MVLTWQKVAISELNLLSVHWCDSSHAYEMMLRWLCILFGISKSNTKKRIDWKFCFLVGTATSLPETVVCDCPVENKPSHLALLMHAYPDTSVLPSFLTQMDKWTKLAYFLILGVLPIISCSSRKYRRTFQHYSLKHSGCRNCWTIPNKIWICSKSWSIWEEWNRY